MSATLIRSTADAETWKVLDGTHTRYVRVQWSDDADTVYVYTSDHKGPWVSDGERYESFEAARAAHGLPTEGNA